MKKLFLALAVAAALTLGGNAASASAAPHCYVDTSLTYHYAASILFNATLSGCNAEVDGIRWKYTPQPNGTGWWDYTCNPVSGCWGVGLPRGVPSDYAINIVGGPVNQSFSINYQQTCWWSGGYTRVLQQQWYYQIRNHVTHQWMPIQWAGISYNNYVVC